MGQWRGLGDGTARWREVAHGADRALEVEAQDLPSLIAGTVLAVVDLSYGLESLRPGRLAEAILAPGDPESQIFSALAEVLFWTDARGWLPVEVTVLSETEGTMRLVARCDELDSGRHRPRCLVKAPTLHGMRVRKTGGGLRVRVVVDT